MLNDYRGNNHDLHVSPVPVTVTFGTAQKAITEYDPVQHGIKPVATGKGSTFTLQLPAHPVLLHIVPE